MRCSGCYWLWCHGAGTLFSAVLSCGCSPVSETFSISPELPVWKGEDVLVLHSPCFLWLGTKLTQQLIWVSMCCFHTGGECYLSCLSREYSVIIPGVRVWASLPDSRKKSIMCKLFKEQCWLWCQFLFLGRSWLWMEGREGACVSYTRTMSWGSEHPPHVNASALFPLLLFGVQFNTWLWGEYRSEPDGWENSLWEQGTCSRHSEGLTGV